MRPTLLVAVVAVVAAPILFAGCTVADEPLRLAGAPSELARTNAELAESLADLDRLRTRRDALQIAVGAKTAEAQDVRAWVEVLQEKLHELEARP